MTCRQFEYRRAAGHDVGAEDRRHVATCPSCRQVQSLSVQVAAALPRLLAPSVAGSFDTYLTERVLAAAARPAPRRRAAWWEAVPALPATLRVALWMSPVGVVLASAGGRQDGVHGGLVGLSALAGVAGDARLLMSCAGLLVAFLVLLMCEQGRRWLMQAGLITLPASPDTVTAPRAVWASGNPIYDRYLSMWSRGGHVLGAAPALLLSCMTLAAPLLWFYRIPVFSVAVLLLWAIGQGIPRGYLTVGAERQAGTDQLVALSGMSSLEVARGYLMAAVAPTLVEVLGACLWLGALALAGLMPWSMLISLSALALVLGLWSSVLGMTMASVVQSGVGGSAVRWLGVCLGSVAALGVASVWKYKATSMLGMDGAYAGWTSLLAASAILFLSLSVILLNEFRQQWGLAMVGSVATVADQPGLQVPVWFASRVNPFITLGVQLSRRSWQRQATGCALALLPVALLGTVHGVPVTMLIFLVWGFAQQYRSMDREQHKATMALLMVTPMSGRDMFLGQMMTAVVPLLLPWTLFHLEASILAPLHLAGAVCIVDVCTLFLGMTGAILGLLNRYAVYVEFERAR